MAGGYANSYGAGTGYLSNLVGNYGPAFLGQGTEGEPNDISSALSNEGQSFQGRPGANPLTGPGGGYLAGSQGNVSADQAQSNQTLAGLWQQAQGGTSDAARAMASGLGQAQSQNTALARSAGAGSSGAAAARNARMQNVTGGINTANQSAVANAQAQTNALSQYNSLASARAQQAQEAQANDQNFAGQMGSMQEQQNAQNDAMQQAYQGMAQNAQYNQLQADTGFYTGWQNVDTAGAIANANAESGFTNSMTGAALGAAAHWVSDERMKTDVADEGEPSMSMADAFLERLHPKSYAYKADPSRTRQLGVMAQDVEQTPTGRTLVGEMPGGTKVIKTAPTMGAVLAGIGRLHERLSQLEGARK